ncbi:hypothetical protein [Candidatus Protochlamydia naegleriophila]|nr:hypothetical protein [Candidatus Protochlamydia naegleriophila]
MVAKFIKKAVKNEHFNSRMECRKKSNKEMKLIYELGVAPVSPSNGTL